MQFETAKPNLNILKNEKLHANHQSNKTTTMSAGNIFIIRSFLISRILIPNPINKTPPTLVSPSMIDGVKNVPKNMAIIVSAPWNKSKGMAETTTPKPNAEASKIAEKKSINDLVKSKSDEPPVPS